MYIDYSKIITDNFRLFISDEKLGFLKAEAKKESMMIKGRYSNVVLKEILSQKADEIVYIYSRNQSKNSIEKALLANNIVFDDENFASILSKGNFDAESLEVFIRLLSYLKTKIAKDDITENDKKYFDKADQYAKKLVNHFTKYIGKTNPNIIINKINELRSYNPELLDKKGTKHTK